MNLEAAKVMKPRRFRTGRWALHAFGMRRGTAVRNRPDIRGRRRFRPGRDGSEWGMLLDAEARKRGVSGDPTASERGSLWGGRLISGARGGYREAV